MDLTLEETAALEKGLAAGDVFDMVDTSASGYVTFKELARALTTSAQVNRFLHECGDARLQKFRAAGRTRVIQRRFNVSVPRARVPETGPTLRERSER